MKSFSRASTLLLAIAAEHPAYPVLTIHNHGFAVLRDAVALDSKRRRQRGSLPWQDRRESTKNEAIESGLTFRTPGRNSKSV